MTSEQSPTGIKQMPPGKPFTAYCVVRGRELKYRQQGTPYLVLELGDRSGRLKARIWDRPQALYETAREGDTVKIRAIVQIFQGRKELKVLNLRPSGPEDPVSLEALLPVSGKDLEAYRERLESHVASVADPFLGELLRQFFGQVDLARAYMRSPSGKLWHHNYLGGVLEHVVVMLELGTLLQRFYPAVDLNLLKTGIILHHAGKVREYSLDGFIEFSDAGRLLGYRAMGYEWVAGLIDGIRGFPGELRNGLLHLLVIHPPEAGQRPAVQPMTLEAIILSHLLLLDADVNAVCRIIENDVLPGSRWSKYIPLLERFIYAGEVRKP